MKIRIFLALTLILQFNLTWGQEITLTELIYFQKEKNSLKIDSVLLTKDKWDCNCYRDGGHIDWIKQWIYDIPDSTKENIDKDYIRFDQVGHGFSSIITYYTTDKNKSTFIISEMKNRNLSEEKIKIIGNDSISARISFYVADEVAIQTVIGENKTNGTGKYAFILMDKADYLKDLMIR